RNHYALKPDLAELEISDSLPPVVELCEMLADNPNLRVFHLTLSGGLMNEFDPPLIRRVLLPMIEELVLSSVRSKTWALQLLSDLDAPNLKDLWVDVWGLTAGGLPNLELNSAFPSLQHLATNLRHELLGALLFAHPTLGKLTLLKGYDSESIVALGREPWLLPRLGHLMVSHFTRDALALSRMVKARQAGGVSAPNSHMFTYADTMPPIRAYLKI
ncbi:hypothetical protein FRC12_010704, partial [Ceratobasidium sp. 428]